MMFDQLDRSELARLLLVNLTEDEVAEVLTDHLTEDQLMAMVQDSRLGQVTSEGGQEHLVWDLDTRLKERLNQQPRVDPRRQFRRAAEAYGLDV